MFKRMTNQIKASNFIIKVIDSFLGKGAYSIFTIIFSLVCARLYGADGLGEFTYAFTIVTLLSVLAKLGLDSGLTYALPKNQYKQVSFSFLVNLIFSIIIAIIFGIWSDNEYIKYMLPIIWLYSVESLFFSLYKYEGKFKEYYLINGFLSMILRIILVVIFYYTFGQNTLNLIIAVIISLIFSNSLYFLYHRKKFQKVYYDKEIIYYSFPLLLTNATALLMGKIDILMLGSFTTNKEVGIYQVVLQISGFISVILVIFISVLAPRFATLYHNSEILKLKTLYINSTRILFLLSFSFAAFVIIFSKFILNIFGESFIEGQMALIFMCIGQFINVAVGAVWTLMAMSGKPKFQLYANIFALVINIILNAALIPKYGIEGAGFASMITISISNIIGYIVVKKELKVKVFKIF